MISINRLNPATLFRILALLFFSGICLSVYGHGVSGTDAAFLSQNQGFQFIVYLYLGAKHMVTGYDHLMFLFGVIFYLTSIRSVAIYVSLFAVGHSITLLAGVLMDWHVSAYLIDAIIGLSVVYKAFDNLGGFERLLGHSFNDKPAVFIFGLFHGLGLATKLQDLNLNEDGLVPNLLSFNLGVEIGQILALLFLLLVLGFGQRLSNSPKPGIAINLLLMVGGFALATYQLVYYFSA